MISNDKFMEQFEALEYSENFKEILKFNEKKDEEYLEKGLFGMLFTRQEGCK